MDESTLILEYHQLPRPSRLSPTLEYPEVHRGESPRRRPVERTWGRTLFRTLVLLMLLAAIFGAEGTHHLRFASEALGIDASLEVELEFR
jgi:hypothetical protein